MTTCAYYRHECSDTTRDHFSMCGSAKCPPKVNDNLTIPKKSAPTTEPAAPETREEVKTMPNGQPAEIGKCQKCGGEGEKLYKSKTHPGDYCKKCNKAAMNAAFNAKRTVQQGATKAHDAAKAKSAPPSKPAPPIAPPRPAPAPSAPVKAPPAVVPQGRAVTLVLTVCSVAALRLVLALTESLDGVSVGLEG